LNISNSRVIIRVIALFVYCVFVYSGQYQFSQISAKQRC